MAGNSRYREELREAVRGFGIGQAGGPIPVGLPIPGHLNIYLFGPQGSGKTSFIRTCFRALYGPKYLERGLERLEESLHRTDDGTSLYSIFPLTDRICIHDTRGQREYTQDEMEQLRLILEGRARPNSLVQQRKRYWLLLREFWRSDEQMRRTFSRSVMLNKATLDTEPHFAFLVLDPNQQELLLEDMDFRQCYGSLVSDFSDRGVPHALLCTHGDTMTPKLRSSLLQLPDKLGCRPPGQPRSSEPLGPGGVQRPQSGPGAGASPPPSGAHRMGSSPADKKHSSSSDKLQRMPDIVRIVTNYVHRQRMAQQPKPSDCDQEGNDVQQDIHLLLVLLDALRQADYQVMQRLLGERPTPLANQAEVGCPIL
mmetsp:Transcript_89276/g.168207  ORF Transcript_89276/g.168207 Transcript_89276/m.168207 type:complete len:368 (-) Transcript_89276:10-1113(-)